MSVRSESELFELLSSSLREQKGNHISRGVVDKVIPSPAPAAASHSRPHIAQRESTSDNVLPEKFEFASKLVKPPAVRVFPWSPRKKSPTKPTGWEKTPTGRPYYLNSRDGGGGDVNSSFTSHQPDSRPTTALSNPEHQDRGGLTVRPKTAGGSGHPSNFLH